MIGPEGQVQSCEARSHPPEGVQESRIFTGAAVTRLDVNQQEVEQCLVSFAQGPPALLSFRDDSKRILPCIPPGQPPCPG